MADNEGGRYEGYFIYEATVASLDQFGRRDEDAGISQLKIEGEFGFPLGVVSDSAYERVHPESSD